MAAALPTELTLPSIVDNPASDIVSLRRQAGVVRALLDELDVIVPAEPHSGLAEQIADELLYLCHRLTLAARALAQVDCPPNKGVGGHSP
ncbi:MAG: hypothetical protein U0271_09250 [Polyangiaceae bacterium]